jgi:hypothetical protein
MDLARARFYWDARVEKTSHDQMGGNGKTKRVWEFGLHRYQIDEPMPAFKMDCKTGERWFRYVYFTLEKEIPGREGFFSVNPSGGVSIVEGASWHKVYLLARVKIYYGEWEKK